MIKTTGTGARGGRFLIDDVPDIFTREDVTEKITRNITIDSVDQFVRRIAEGKPENVGARGAESTLTAILGRMAMDARREVTWDEMMKG